MLCDCVGGRCWEPLEEPHHGSVERFLFESSLIDDGCGDLDRRVFEEKNIFHLLTVTIGHHRRPRRAAEGAATREKDVSMRGVLLGGLIGRGLGL